MHFGIERHICVMFNPQRQSWNVKFEIDLLFMALTYGLQFTRQTRTHTHIHTRTEKDANIHTYDM